jgi:hypothetical protein
MNDDKVYTQYSGNLLEFDITEILYANHCGNDSVVDNTVFVRLNRTNQSVDAIDFFHLAMWTDFDLGGNQELIIGQLLSLTANIEGGNSNTNYTYSWSTGEINATINATASIPYSVKGTNTLTGCSKTDIVQVKF